MKFVENGAVGFYQGKPYRLRTKVIDERKKRNKIEYEIVALWNESNHHLALHIPEQDIGVTKIIKPEEFIIAPSDAPMEKEAYEEALLDKILFKRLLAETDKKVEGEEIPRHTLLNCALSVFLKNEKNLPHVLINSVSSAGKGHVGKAVFDLLPAQNGEYMTKITPEAFTYWKADNQNWTWDGKLLFLDDVKQDFLNCDTFKVMLTEGSKAVTVVKGQAVELHIPGKPLVFLTTAHSMPNDELTNRMNFVTLDESEEQTKAILKRQALEAAGIREKEKYDWVLTNSLSFLERVEVIVPFADKLPDYFPSSEVGIRRDFPRFLLLIKAVAALYQRQRDTDNKGRVIAEQQDYDIAKRSFEGFVFESGVKLQHKQKKAYDYVKELLERGTRMDEEGRSFVRVEDVENNSLYAPRTWYGILGGLSQKGLLEKDSREGDFNKPYVVYRLGSKKANFELPSFEVLEARN